MFFLVDNYVWFQGKLEGKQVYCMAKLMVSFIYGDIIHNIYIYIFIINTYIYIIYKNPQFDGNIVGIYCTISATFSNTLWGQMGPNLCLFVGDNNGMGLEW